MYSGCFSDYDYGEASEQDSEIKFFGRANDVHCHFQLPLRFRGLKLVRYSGVTTKLFSERGQACQTKLGILKQGIIIDLYSSIIAKNIFLLEVFI